MTSQEVAELFLTALYDLADSAPHPHFLFTVNEFAPTFGIDDKDLIVKAFTDLESRGLVFCASMDNWGGISAGITPEGAIFVERGGETGIIERYRKDPMAFRTSATAAEAREPAPAFQDVRPPAREMQEATAWQPPAGPPFQRQEVEALLSLITGGLWRDPSLTDDVRQDLLSDLETLKPS